ncbi:MAG TPA: fibronectin type III-like domain-contianing protein, partial [Polyangiaceae bacterium]
VVYDYYHGYRWLDKKGIVPEYPFGYGLSYTTFGYSNLIANRPSITADGTLTVSVDVTNTGAVAGSEVVELYVDYGNTAVTGVPGRPVKELKAFARVPAIAPGATRTATLSVKASDLGYWDASKQTMTVEKMAYPFSVGPSADLTDPNALRGTFTIE